MGMSLTTLAKKFCAYHNDRLPKRTERKADEIISTPASTTPATESAMKKTATKKAQAKKTAPKKTANTKKRTVKPSVQRARTPVEVRGGRKGEVAALMRRSEGVTVAQIQDQTGMLPHSARALISRIFGDLGPTETSSTAKTHGGGTTYRILKKPTK